MDKQIQQRLTEEVVRFAKTMETRWHSSAVATFENLGDKEGIELSEQVKNGYYLLADTKIIENPEITDENYLRYVEGIYNNLTENYDRLSAIRGEYSGVKHNPVPDFPSIVKSIFNNEKPEVIFIVKASKTKISVESDGTRQSFANNLRAGGKVFDLLNSIGGEKVGYKLIHFNRELIATMNLQEFKLALGRFFEM